MVLIWQFIGQKRHTNMFWQTLEMLVKVGKYQFELKLIVMLDKAGTDYDRGLIILIICSFNINHHFNYSLKIYIF